MSDAEQISAYVLRELPPDELEQLRRREETDAAFAAEVRAARELLVQLADADWDPVEPPPLAITPAAARPRRRFALVAAAVLLLMVGFAAGALVTGGGSEPPSGTAVALRPLGNAPAGARGSALLQPGSMRLSVRGLPPNAAGSYYEVWMLRSPTQLVSLGSFRVSGDGRAQEDLPVVASTARYPFIDVSLEPADGNPAHSGDSVLRSRRL